MPSSIRLWALSQAPTKKTSVCFWTSFTALVEGSQADSGIATPGTGRGAWKRGQDRSKGTSLFLPGQTWLMDHRAHSQKPSYGGQCWSGVTPSQPRKVQDRPVPILLDFLKSCMAGQMTELWAGVRWPRTGSPVGHTEGRVLTKKHRTPSLWRLAEAQPGGCRCGLIRSISHPSVPSASWDATCLVRPASTDLALMTSSTLRPA